MVFVAFNVTGRENVPMDDGLRLSPEYVAMSCKRPPVAGVYLTEHADLTSLQSEPQNLPEPLLVHEIVPVGEEPLTDAQHMIVDPTTMEVGLQAIATVKAPGDVGDTSTCRLIVAATE